MKINADLVDLSMLYLSFRNSFNFGLQRFGIWKNMIRYITGINEAKILRVIFYKLLDDNVFVKYKRGKRLCIMQ